MRTRTHIRKWIMVTAIAAIPASLVTMALGVWLTARPQVTELSIDGTSSWGKSFLRASGYPVLRIETMERSRERVCYLSIVGKDRPAEWFYQLGLEELCDESPASELMLSEMAFLLDDVPVSRTVSMHHPQCSTGVFYYVPELGVLVRF